MYLKNIKIETIVIRKRKQFIIFTTKLIYNFQTCSAKLWIMHNYLNAISEYNSSSYLANPFLESFLLNPLSSILATGTWTLDFPNTADLCLTNGAFPFRGLFFMSKFIRGSGFGLYCCLVDRVVGFRLCLYHNHIWVGSVSLHAPSTTDCEL